MYTIEPHVKHQTIRKGKTNFSCTSYFHPSQLSPEIQEEIINRLGDRMVKGKVCLGTTKDVVREGLQTQLYNAFFFVTNTSLPPGQQDIATGCFQYADFCRTGKPHIWITDLCRQMNAHPKPIQSPTQVLLRHMETVAKQIGHTDMSLMVDQTDPTGHHVLANKVYPGYGFAPNTTCVYEGHTIMNKAVNPVKQKPKKRKTRKRKTQKHK